MWNNIKRFLKKIEVLEDSYSASSSESEILSDSQFQSQSGGSYTTRSRTVSAFYSGIKSSLVKKKTRNTSTATPREIELTAYNPTVLPIKAGIPGINTSDIDFELRDEEEELPSEHLETIIEPTTAPRRIGISEDANDEEFYTVITPPHFHQAEYSPQDYVEKKRRHHKRFESYSIAV